MALLELYPIVVACVLWGKDWSGRRVLFNCDNMATLEIINKGRSKVNIIMKLMRKLTWCSAISNFTIHAKHVPGCFNSTADAISRLQMNKFRRHRTQTSIQFLLPLLNSYLCIDQPIHLPPPTPYNLIIPSC